MKYNEISHLLEGEYATVLKKAELYSFIQNTPVKKHDEVLMDLTDFLLTAQKKNRPVKDVIGYDIEAFCREFVGNNSLSSRLSRLLQGLFYIAWLVVILCVFDFIATAMNGKPIISSVSEIGSIIIGGSCGFLITVITEAVFKPLFFKWKKLSSKLYFAVMLSLILISGTLTGILLSFSIKTIYLLSAAALYIILCICFNAVRNYRETGCFFRSKRSEEKDAKQSVEMLRYQYEFTKDYERKNNKLSKKGKPKMTRSAYMHHIEDHNRKTRIYLYVLYALVFAFVAVNVIYEGLTNNWYEATLLCGILLVAEIPVLLIFTYLFQKSIKIRTRLLKLCKEKNSDIFDLEI